MKLIFNQLESLKQGNPSLDKSGHLTKCQKLVCQYYREMEKLANDPFGASLKKANQLASKEACLIRFLQETKNLNKSMMKMKVEFVLNQD